MRLSKLARPAFRSSSLFAALLFKEHMRRTHRGTEDLLRLSGSLRRLRDFVGVPDLSTFWWFPRRLLVLQKVDDGLHTGDRIAHRRTGIDAIRYAFRTPTPSGDPTPRIEAART